MVIAFAAPVAGDPLFPSAALLPLSDTRGAHIALVGKPGPLRPLSAALGLRADRVRKTRHDRDPLV